MLSVLMAILCATILIKARGSRARNIAKARIRTFLQEQLYKNSKAEK
jgi:hypothetical protein